MSVPNDRLYSEQHIWLKEQNGELLLGVTDFAQTNIGMVEFLDLPAVGDHLTHGSCFGSAESSKAVTDMLAPINAKVTTVNTNLEDAPELINDSPYDEGWILKLVDYQLVDLTTLWNAEAYASNIS